MPTQTDQAKQTQAQGQTQAQTPQEKVAAAQASAPAQAQTQAAPASPPAEATATPDTRYKRDVDYTLEIVDDLPGTPVSAGGGGGPRNSVFEDRLTAIKNETDKNGKWARLASYANGSAASAAANVLRQRHGQPWTEGYTFQTTRVEDRILLFARYDPDKAETGGKEKWAKMEAERIAANVARKAERDKDAGKAAATAAPATSAASASATPPPSSAS